MLTLYHKFLEQNTLYYNNIGYLEIRKLQKTF